MADYIYTTVPGKIKPLLDKIRQVGIPPKASVAWLKTIGFTSSNDTGLLPILKAIGFTDATTVPTVNWSNFRGSHHKKVLGEAIKIGYADLFSVYPDASQAANKDLEHVFSISSSAGKQVIQKTIATFKALCECAEFVNTDGHIHSNPNVASLAPVVATTPPAPPGTTVNKGSLSPSVHIDIQIHISAEASTDQIDQIFKSMGKHLYGAKGV
jgi:hypothetical protein